MSIDERTTPPQTTARHSAVPPVLAVTIALHPDVERIGEIGLLLDLNSPGERQVSRTEPVFRTPSGRQTRSIETTAVSRQPVTFELLDDGRLSIRTVQDGSSLRVAGAGCDLAGVVEVDRVRDGFSVTLSDSVVLWVHPFVAVFGEPPDLGLVGDSAAMRQLRSDVLRVADLDVPVLLRGESGVGKELLADAIHQHSGRAEASYVPVNMAAIPPSMAASELFGHVRGAFTGASQARAGYFTQADGGTLFLDEIGDLATDVQPLLLRALQSGEVQTVGASKPTHVNVRVIAATDSNLEHAIDQGQFRMPLLQRLAGYELRVPSLRERRDDIPRLVRHFLAAELKAVGEPDRLRPEEDAKRAWLPVRVMEALLLYHWPGNVRELGNVVRQMVISNRGNRRFRIDPSLRRLMQSTGVDSTPPASATAAGPAPAPAAEEAPTHRDPAATAEPLASPPREAPSSVDARALTDAQIVAAMRGSAFRVSAAAKRLGVSRSWLNGRIDRTPGLRKSTELGAEEIRAALTAHREDQPAAAMALGVSERALVLQMARLGFGD